jgi:hypothetical protein
MKIMRDRERRAQPQAKHAFGFSDDIRCRCKPLDRAWCRERLQVLSQRGKNILNQCVVAFTVAPLQQLLGAAAEVFRAVAHLLGIKLPNFVITLQPEALCQPGQRRRRNACPTGLLSHGEESDVGRVIDHPARGLLQLWRQGIEPRGHLLEQQLHGKVSSPDGR